MFRNLFFLLFIFCLILSSIAFCQTQKKEKIAVLDILYEKEHTNQDSLRNSLEGLIVNNIGDVVWRESCGHHSYNLFYWNKTSGIEKIDITNDLLELGLEPIRKSLSETNFDFGPIYFDNSGNVFLCISHKSLENLPDNSAITSKENKKIGIWNKKHGFKLLDLDGIQNILRFNISPERIVVGGLISDQFKFAILQMPKDFWNQEIEFNTPWHKPEIGDFSFRLYAMGEMYKFPKPWFSIDNTIISLMIEMEAASILDTLQCNAKKALFAIEESRAKGQYNEQAEKEYDISINHINNLSQYLELLDISHERIFSLELPSSKWGTDNSK